MANKLKNWFFAILFLGLTCQPLFAQEQPLKDLIEHKREQKYAFYASTLRMINLKENPDYNELVNGVEKLLIYTLDSATKADKSYREITLVYSQIGFEEYASAFGGTISLSIMGREGRENEFVGFYGQGDMVVAFYLRGTIGWQKIPTLLNTIEGDDMINIFDLTN